ncbi:MULTISPECIES: hypothetical protein [Marinobacter]|uniref:hypothetical protein n=1 Tax=Marinobacter TaxID=2742 RepID=UPI000DAE77CD|nr:MULTISPECIES: hypothetical protein [Marinobacter]
MDTVQSSIELKTGNGLWIAKHDGPHTAQLIDLFGSDELPTAFESSTPREKVIACLRKRNPGFRIG